MAEEKTSDMEWEKDVVYLYSFPREIGKQVPNISPFAVKLETWLRWKEIEYKFIGGMRVSSKGQIPFIEFNGQEYPDTGFIINMLTEHFKLDPNDGLSEIDLAISRAFSKMVEENTCWTYFIYRYVKHSDEYKQFLRPAAPDSVTREASWKGLQEHVGQRAKLHGIGRHSEEELAKIGIDDFTAISRYLGNKRFFHGDKMTLIDCVIFGQLSQVVFVDMKYPHKEALKTTCKNLTEYTERIKQTLWPDWSEICDSDRFEIVDGTWKET